MEADDSSVVDGRVTGVSWGPRDADELRGEDVS